MPQDPILTPVQDQLMASPKSKTPNSAWIAQVRVFWTFTLTAMLFVGCASVKNEAPLPKRDATSSARPTAPVASSEKSADSKTYIGLESTPRKLLAAFNENPIKAALWLKGKGVRIKAPIYSLKHNVDGSGSTVVTFKPTTGTFRESTIAFWFDRMPSFMFRNLQKGHVVTVDGEYKKQKYGVDLQFEGLSFGRW